MMPETGRLLVRKAASPLLLCLLVAGCLGTSWRERYLEDHPHATQYDVTEALGRPVGILHDGDDTVWTYVASSSSYWKWGGEGTLVQTTVYVLRFDRDGRLIRWTRRDQRSAQ
jgi:hypothetical protein